MGSAHPTRSHRGTRARPRAMRLRAAYETRPRSRPLSPLPARCVVPAPKDPAPGPPSSQWPHRSTSSVLRVLPHPRSPARGSTPTVWPRSAAGEACRRDSGTLRWSGRSRRRGPPGCSARRAPLRGRPARAGSPAATAEMGRDAAKSRTAPPAPAPERSPPRPRAACC